MSFRDLVWDTFRTLWAHKVRTFLTMFGIAWGIVSITLMVAAGEGLRVGQARVAEGFGKNILIVFAGRTSLQAGGLRAGRVVRWRDTDHADIAAESWACRYVLPELTRTLAVRSRLNSSIPLVTGSLPAFAEVRTLDVAEGRFYNDQDQFQGRRVAFLGSDLKRQLFGSNPAVGETIHIADYPYTVVGVMRAKDQDSAYDGRDITKAFIPFRSMVRDFPEKPPLPPNSIDQFIVTAPSLEQHDTCKSQVRRALGRMHGFDPADEQAAAIWDTVEESRAFRKMTDGMKFFLGAVGVVTLMLGGIGVMNVMLVAVRERTREIGVRKAVGATRGAVVGQFFAETMLIVFMSGGAGMAVAYGLCGLVNLIPMPQFFAGLLPTWQSGLLSAGLLGLVALFAGVYPASRAAAVDPIEALRYEAGG